MDLCKRARLVFSSGMVEAGVMVGMTSDIITNHCY